MNMRNRKNHSVIGMQLTAHEKQSITSSAQVMSLSVSGYISLLFTAAWQLWATYEGRGAFDRALRQVVTRTQHLRGRRRKSTAAGV